MRRLIAMMGMLSILGFGASAQTRDKPLAGQVCLLMVSGMHCGACAARVEKTAKKIAGVTGAKVSQPKGTAKISYDPAKTTPGEIAKIITDRTGFTAEAASEDQKKD